MMSENIGKRAALADIVGNNLYGLVVGGSLDYLAGLDAEGILASRFSGTIVNTVSGVPYGWWREKTFQITRTDESHGKVRQTLVDLLAFNTFQTPLYAILVGIGSKVSEGNINWDKMGNGALYLAMISPLIGPTMGWFMDGVRKIFRAKTAAEGNY